MSREILELGDKAIIGGRAVVVTGHGCPGCPHYNREDENCPHSMECVEMIGWRLGFISVEMACDRASQEMVTLSIDIETIEEILENYIKNGETIEEAMVRLLGRALSEHLRRIV